MAQRLRALTDHSENPGFSASTRMVAKTVCNSISRETSVLFSPLWALHTGGIYIFMQADVHTQEIKTTKAS